MAQWVNRLQQHFRKSAAISLLCEISGALHLAQPGLTAGWQAGWQADEIQVNFEIFKIGCRRNIQLVASFNQGTALCIQAGFFG